MMLIEKTKSLLKEIKSILAKENGKEKITGNTFFMQEGDILCLDRQNGESRFPYANDGYIMWVHSTGYIHVKSGLFNVFKPLFDNNEAPIEFFAGIKREDGTYFPISLLGAAKQLFEPFCIERYLVYTLSSAYFITETEIATFVLRASMSKKQELQFSFGCINKGNTPISMYLTSYFDPFMKNGENDTMWEYKTRKCTYLENGNFISVRGNCKPVLEIKRKLTGIQIQSNDSTTTKESLLGGIRGYLPSAKPLKTGEFFKDVLRCNGDIASEIIKFRLNQEGRIDFVLSLDMDGEKIEGLQAKPIDIKVMDLELFEIEREEREKFDRLRIEFHGFEEKEVNAFALNHFIKKVQKQVDNCAMGRYYVEDLMGVRDVYQQLEQALLWDSKKSRGQMLTALSFLNPSGRAPRQYSLPLREGENPKMDWREFVDQGNWIISCFYSYLSWTDDYSILNEEIGYCENIEGKNICRKDINDTALQHLLKITDYLIGNLDTEDGTNCLRILFGDWNDAMDGLGRTKDEGKQFGTGVSVMASLHLYQNLWEITQILEKIGGYEDKITYYLEIRKILKKGILDNAIEINEKKELRLLHGWGDHKSYKIGSFCDSDGEDRISFASHAFWVSSGLIEETPELKEGILKNFNVLKSKYGLRTLTPAFSSSTPGVGRIATISKGVAENECVYIHATMFSVMALFGLGSAEMAWREFYKVLPIANEQITTTPFVMSNSYLDNPDLGYFGQSSIDWYTGSGTVCLKNLIRGLIGVNANLHGIIIQTANKLPCKQIQMELFIKGKKVYFEYQNKGIGQRSIYFNDIPLKMEYNALIETQSAFIAGNMLADKNIIKVLD